MDDWGPTVARRPSPKDRFATGPQEGSDPNYSAEDLQDRANLEKSKPVAGKSYKNKASMHFRVPGLSNLWLRIPRGFKVGSLGSHSSRLQRPWVVGRQKWE